MTNEILEAVAKRTKDWPCWNHKLNKPCPRWWKCEKLPLNQLPGCPKFKKWVNKESLESIRTKLVKKKEKKYGAENFV